MESLSAGHGHRRRVGAVAGRAIELQFDHYVAIGLIQIVPPANSTPDQFETLKAATVNGLTSQQNLITAAAHLSSQGRTVSPTDIQRGLTVQPIQATRCVQVSYTSVYRTLSAAVANTVMQDFLASAATKATILAMATTPAAPNGGLGLLAGIIVGFVFAAGSIAIRKARSRRRGQKLK